MRLPTLITGQWRTDSPSRRKRRSAGELRLESLEDRCLLSLDVTTFPLGGPDQYVSFGDITSGPDGNLWFTAIEFDPDDVPFIGRITPDGNQTRFPVTGYPGEITSGPDGNLWFTLQTYTESTTELAIGRMTLDGQFTSFTVSTDSNPDIFSSLEAITGGPDGNVWFTRSTSDYAGSINKITPTGQITEYSLDHPIDDGSLSGITAGPDGSVWFTFTTVLGDPYDYPQQQIGKIGRITPHGRMTEFPLHLVPPTSQKPPGEYDSPHPQTFEAVDITTGPDGNLWFTETATYSNRIGRITPGGDITDFLAPSIDRPQYITAGADGNLWFSFRTESAGLEPAPPDNLLGRITTSGIVTVFPPASTTDPGLATGTPGLATGADGNLWFPAGRYSAQGITRLVPPTTLTGQLSLTSDNGERNDDHVTNTPRPLFEGLARPGTVVKLYARSLSGGRLKPIGQTHVNARGEWRVKSRPLPDGTYSIFAAEKAPGHRQRFSTPVPLFPFADQARDTSPLPPASDPSALVIDTIAPRVTDLVFIPDELAIEVTFQDKGGSGFYFGNRYGSYYPGRTSPASERNVSVKPPHTSFEQVYFVFAAGDDYFLESPPPPLQPMTVEVSLWGDDPPPYLLRYFSHLGVYDAAGNPLDGEFHGRFPSGNGRPGGDFVTLLGGIHQRIKLRRL